MTEVKGSALIPMQQFIQRNFGRTKYDIWLKSLSPEVCAIFSLKLSSSAWYPMDEYLTVPTRKCCDLFYDGKIRGAWEMGRFSAEHSLTGFYKVFTKIGTVDFIINKASKIISTYYRPCELTVLEYEDNHCRVLISELEGNNVYIENRICGWIEKALEIHGCSQIEFSFIKSAATGEKDTEFNLSWK